MFLKANERNEISHRRINVQRVYIRVIDSKCVTRFMGEGYAGPPLAIVLVAIRLRRCIARDARREMHAWPRLSLIGPGLA